MRVSAIVSKLDKGYTGRVRLQKLLQENVAAIRRDTARQIRKPAPAPPLVPGSSPLP